MEDILLDNVSSEKGLTDCPNTVITPSNLGGLIISRQLPSTSIISNSSSNNGATVTVDDPGSGVMSMLYIQPSNATGNLNSLSTTTSNNNNDNINNNNGILATTASLQPLPSTTVQPIIQQTSTTTTDTTTNATVVQQQPLVVNNNPLTGFDQIVLQSITPSNQPQIPAQLFAIRRQVNTVTTPSATGQNQKNILVRKSNASNAQIMPLGISQADHIQNQAAGKSRVAYLGTIIKPKPQEPLVLPAGTITAAPNLKQKVVFTPVYSQISPTSSASTNLQSQSSKHMTNLLLPVSISQSSAPAAPKPNLNFKSNFYSKFNNGQNSNDSKSTITVLRESKTSNSTTIPPPLHPIANMSLLSASKSGGNSTDSIKINENPDSAVITPIPKKDESNLSDKRKKTFSNILRQGEKRGRKQSFTKAASMHESNVVDVSSYVLNNSELDEKDKRKDKESDDDITLIKVIPNEDKKGKRLSMSEEIKIEVVKGLNRNGVEVIEKYEKVNGRSSNDETKDLVHQNDTNVDGTKVLEWKDGVGSLPGTALKFRMNEFGFIESVEDDDSKEKNKNKNIGDKENVCLTQNSSKSSTPTIVNEKITEEKKSQNFLEDDKSFCCCQGCGCYGPLSEFYTPVACSLDCAQYIENRKQQKIRKEKESNKEIRTKKKRKKLLHDQLIKDEDKKESKSKLRDYDDKSKDSVDKYEKINYKEKSSTDEDTKDTNISLMDEESQGDSESKYPWLTGKLGFSWPKYLEFTKAKAAPTKLFKDAFPEGKNNFKVGMKLEGIDPNNPSHYCVLTVAEVSGYRLRLHFDGYAENFDFWVNADSMDIFPVGWAEKNGHKLQPPKGYVQSNFNWNAYLKICKAQAAPKTLFSNKNSMLPTGFRVGMKLEAVDRKHSSSVCVASVSDVMDSRILVHFDSWDDIYDYWADVSSPYIHPVGWCHHNGRSLTPPNYYKDAKAFSWDEYLKSSNSIAAPARAFKQRPPCGFKRGMKLEVVDKRLPQVIRVTTVEDVKDHMLKIRFDGWPENHAYWVDDDSMDIHPMGWCAKTGHPLEPPLTQDNLNDRPECGTYGCRGIGHVKGPKFATHNSASGCPYSPQNLNKIKTVIDRLNLKHEVNDFEDDVMVEKSKYEKPERRAERIDKRYSSFEEKLIKVENIKKEDDYSSDKNDKLDLSDRFSSKRNKDNSKDNSDGQTDDEDLNRRRRKRKIKEEPGLSLLNSSFELSTSRSSYAPDMPEKQLRNELYQSVYDPGYKPLPDAPHIWAKHSSALNRVVAKQTTNPRRWSNEEVIKFIQSLPNCKEIGNVFRKNSIDGESFMMLTQEDLVSILGLKLGPALKLYNSIVLLRKKVT